MPRIVIREERCKSCGQCVLACPVGILDFAAHLNTRGYRPAIVKADAGGKCIGCASCARMCPDRCITVYR